MTHHPANFLDACEANPTFCGCALSHVESRVTFAAFQTAETNAENGGDLVASVTDAASSCQH